MATESITQCPYTSEQIARYLKHISLPSRFLDQNADGTPTSSVKSNNLNTLAALQRHHMSAIPFENLALHYSYHHQISLDTQDLFEKFVDRSRGGYCMEQNIFLCHMLRGLGFRVYTVGARVKKRVNGVPTGDYMGFTHMVNIITFPSSDPSKDKKRYMVDAGFGGDGPTKPLELLDPGVVTRNIGTQQMQLKHENIASNADPDQRLWVYKLQNSPAEPWKDCYCFGELEFLTQDYEIMSFWVNECPQSWFTHMVAAVRMMLEDDEIVGKLMLNGAEVKINTGGRTRPLKICKTEEERIEVLKTQFGLEFDRKERDGIKGMASALTAAPPRFPGDDQQ